MDRSKLNRDKEVEILHNLKEVLVKAKQELNNDLTKLAMRNLPMMVQHDSDITTTTTQADDKQQQQQLQSAGSSNNQQQTEESYNLIQMRQLEPLDLDI